MNGSIKKYIKILVIAILILLVGLLIAEFAYANTFPATLNTWGSGETISSSWANALESKIGANSSAVTASLDYQLNNSSSEDPGHTHTAGSIADSYILNTGDTATGDYTFDTDTFFIDASNDRVGIGVVTPSYVLDVYGGAVRAGDNLLVGNTTGSASFRGEGDIYAADGIKAMGGLYTEAKAYGAGVEVLDNSAVTTYTNIIYGDATLTAATQTITDSHASFTSAYKGQFVRIISSTPSFTGATGEIIGVPSSTTIVVSFATAGGDTIVDATGMSFVVYPHPIFFAGDNGVISASIGENVDAKFEVHIDDGKGFHGVYIEDTAGVDQHQAHTVDTDIMDYTGVVGGNYLMYTSSSSNAVSASILSLEMDIDNITNSHLGFIDITGLGANLSSDVDVMHIEGLALTDHIIHQGSPDVLQAAYYDNGDGTTASSTEAFNSASTDIALFENDNSIIYIGSDTEFTTIGYALSTNGTRDIYAEYYYCTGDNTWVALPGVTDTTNGERITGTISFPNPGDRGTCDEEMDSTAFPDTSDLYYIAVKRTRNNYGTQKPIENLVTISGGGDFMYLDSYGLKPVASAGSPYTCDGTHTGKTYYDSTATALLWCTGSAWIAFAETADVTVHNNLTGIQGGTATEYYHLTSAEHTELQAGYLTLTAWYATTTHALMSSLPSLATVGTIGTGVWEGTDIGVAHGGTGVSTLTDHGVIVGSGAAALTALSVGTNGQILVGSTGADPVFATMDCADSLTCTLGAGTLEIDVDDDFIKNTGDVGTGVYDFGGAFSFEIPNGAATTTEAAGEIVVDTTSDYFQYYGGANNVVTSKYEKCITIASSSTATYEDTIIWSPYKAITVVEERCRGVNGTSLVVNISDGSSDMDAITCGTSLTKDSDLSNNSWSADEQMTIEFGTNTGGMDTVNYCLIYTYDVD